MPGYTSAISLHLPSIDVRRSSGKCLRQGAGPGRDRADCSGGAPSPPRASVETVMPGSRGGGQDLGARKVLGPCPPQASPKERPELGREAVPSQRPRSESVCGSQRTSPSVWHWDPSDIPGSGGGGPESAPRTSGFIQSRNQNRNTGLEAVPSSLQNLHVRTSYRRAHVCVYTRIHIRMLQALSKDLVATPAIPSPQLPGQSVQDRTRLWASRSSSQARALA